MLAQLLEAASGSPSSALQMAAVHAAYNILASQKGWKGLGAATLPPASSSNAADDIVSGMSSSLVPDQLLQVSHWPSSYQSMINKASCHLLTDAQDAYVCNPCTRPAAACQPLPCSINARWLRHLAVVSQGPAGGNWCALQHCVRNWQIEGALKTCHDAQAHDAHEHPTLGVLISNQSHRQ